MLVRYSKYSYSIHSHYLFIKPDVRILLYYIINRLGSQALPKSASYVSINRNHSSGDLNEMQHNLSFMRKIPQGAEASNILVGELDFLEKTLSAFIRLDSSVLLGDLTEVPVPTRFLFILLQPPSLGSGKMIPK